MKRVLVTGGANIGKAGVGTIVYKWGQNFDSNVIVYDYLMQRGLPDETYQHKIQEKGGIIYTCESKMSPIGIIKWVKNIIANNGYEIIHINSDSAYLAAAYIYAAKKGGIKKIYVHSHCTKIDDINPVRRVIKTLIHYMFRRYVINNTELFLACSELAGRWMFGRRNVDSGRYRLIYNGVEVQRYLYDINNRNRIRNSLGFEDKYIISNIGRLSYQKNQDFLIDVFVEIKKDESDALLVLVGDGPLKSELMNKASNLGIIEDVIFLGNRDDVPALLSAFDVLVMTSRFEGLPVTMVEAQMADLPCVVASTITSEAKFTDQVEYIAGWDKIEWKNAIIRMKKVKRIVKPDEKYESMFNISIAAEKLGRTLIG